MKKNKLILSVILLFITNIGISQDPGDILWKELYGGYEDESFHDVKQTSDSGYIAVGYTTTYGPVVGVKSLWAVKTNSAGETQWTTVLGLGITYGDWANSVAVCPDGSFIIAGETYSYAQNAKDAWILKLDSQGNTLWTTTYSGPGYDVASSVIINDAGNYAITGYSYNSSNNSDVLFLEYDPSGNLLQDNTYGGAEDDWTTDLCQTTDGGYILTGYTESFGVEGQDFYIIKLDAQGDTLWTLVHGWALDQFGRSVEALPGGGAIVTGWSGIFVTNCVIILMEISPTGTILWTRNYGFGNFDTANDIIITNDGGYLIAGKGDDDFLALKTTSEGDVEWSNNSFWATAIGVLQNYEGDYIIAGAETVGIKAQGILICLQGDPYNHAPDEFNLLQPGNGDTLTSITEPVEFIWEAAHDPEDDTLSYTLSIFNPDINLFFPFLADTTYSFDGSAILELNTTYNWVVTASDGQYATVSDTFSFVTPLGVGIGETGNAIPEKNVLLQNYPNPVSSVTTISYELLKSGNINLSVYDSRGNLLETLVDGYTPAGSHSVRWDASEARPGLFIIIYNEGNNYQFHKIIKK